MPKPEFKADQVGSLLRPTELLQARQAYKADMIGLERLRSLENEAIIDVLAMQEQVGIEVFSDGEMRRYAWMSDLADAVEGFIDDHNRVVGAVMVRQARIARASCSQTSWSPRI